MNEGGNGHWHQVDVTGRSWVDACTSASAAHGHLLTVQSQVEAAFVRQIGFPRQPFGSVSKPRETALLRGIGTSGRREMGRPRTSFRHQLASEYEMTDARRRMFSGTVLLKRKSPYE